MTFGVHITLSLGKGDLSVTDLVKRLPIGLLVLQVGPGGVEPVDSISHLILLSSSEGILPHIQQTVLQEMVELVMGEAISAIVRLWNHCNKPYTYNRLANKAL